MQAFRKAQKAKDKKKQKQERSKARELGDVKKGTADIEREIRELTKKERASGLTPSERADLDGARSELSRLRKAKEDYVSKNPEARDIVFGKGKEKANGEDDDDDDDEEDRQKYGSVKVGGIIIPVRQKLEAERQGLRFDRKGKLLNPEKSAYYDTVFNPFGVPPPGMPWRARPPTAEELAALAAAEASSDDSDEDDIPLPGQLAPGTSDAGDETDSSDEDDIPLPEGPPPSKMPQLNGHPPLPFGPPPLPLAGLPPLPPTTFPFPRPQGQLQTQQHGFAPPPPPPLPGQRGFFITSPAQAMSGAPAPIPRSGRPPLPFAPIHARPLVSAAASSISAPPSSLPAKPGSIPPPPTGPASAQAETKKFLTEEDLVKLRASATISAAPQVRDLKKEATAFVPQAAIRKRKRPANGTQPATASIAKDAEQGPDAELQKRARSMALPPGFGAPLPSSQANEEADYGDSAGVALPPGFGAGSPANPPLPDDDDDGEAAGVALPPGFHPGFSYEEDGQDQGPAMLAPHTGKSYYLPGMDDDEEEGDYQGPSFPAAGDYASTLPGFDEEEDADEATNEQGMALPPGYKGREYQSVTVEEDND